MAIELATFDNIEEELDALQKDTRTLAHEIGGRHVASQPYQFGPHTVILKLRWRNTQAGHRHVAEWWIDGRRKGWNAMRGIIRESYGL